MSMNAFPIGQAAAFDVLQVLSGEPKPVEKRSAAVQGVESYEAAAHAPAIAEDCRKRAPAQGGAAASDVNGTDQFQRSRPPVMLTIRKVGEDPEAFGKGVRDKLDMVVAACKLLDVDRIDVIAYSLLLRKQASPRAWAVKEYLGSRGVDQNRIFTKAQGPGLFSENYRLGLDNTVVVFIHTKPVKPAQENAASIGDLPAAAPLVRRDAATHLIA